MLLLLPLLAGLLSPIGPAEAKTGCGHHGEELGQRCEHLDATGPSPDPPRTRSLGPVPLRFASGRKIPGRIDIRQEPVLAMPWFHADEVCRVPVKAGLTRSGESLYGGRLAGDRDDDGGAADEGDSANRGQLAPRWCVNASSTRPRDPLDNETNAMLALYTPECGEPCAVLRENCRRLPARGPPRGVRPAADVTREPQLASVLSGAEETRRCCGYGGDVDLHEIVGFINDMTGSHASRTVSWSLALAGGPDRTATQRRAADLVLGRNLQQLSEEVAQAASDLPHSKRYVFYYQRLLRQLMKVSSQTELYYLLKGRQSIEFSNAENAAIDQLLNGGGGGGGGIGGGSKMSRAERDEAHKLHKHHLRGGERQSAEAAAVAEKRRLMEEQQKRLHEEGELAGDEEEFTEQAEAVKATKEEL
uniref:Transmembrane protein n=1 Tax=Macrostomum lignano TaxID=282301 RepID=A0A1I8JPI0_9PLAT